jgi:Flp pilus assembly protein TadG
MNAHEPRPHLDATKQSGQAAAWVSVMLPLFLAVIGLAIDGGIVFAHRRELQNVADSAARAGATQIDVSAFRAGRGDTVVLDAGAARQTAGEYLASRGSGLRGEVTADSRQVVVRVEQDVPTSFLSLVGIGTVRITATAPAEARVGIAGPER